MFFVARGISDVLGLLPYGRGWLKQPIYVKECLLDTLADVELASWEKNLEKRGAKTATVTLAYEYEVSSLMLMLLLLSSASAAAYTAPMLKNWPPGLKKWWAGGLSSCRLQTWQKIHQKMTYLLRPPTSVARCLSMFSILILIISHVFFHRPMTLPI